MLPINPAELADPVHGRRVPRGGSRRPSGYWRAWYQEKRPIFKFVLLLGVFMVVANVILSRDVIRDTAIPKYLEAWAHVSGGVLRVFGEDARVVGSSVSSPRFQVDIKRGCDAVQPTVLFISAVLASPVTVWSKLPGLAIGFFFLMFMNLVRVVTLFYTGIYWPSAFDTMHHDVWQAVFIVLSILAWFFWAVWAVRRTPAVPRASSIHL